MLATGAISNQGKVNDLIVVAYEEFTGTQIRSHQTLTSVINLTLEHLDRCASCRSKLDFRVSSDVEVIEDAVRHIWAPVSQPVDNVSTCCACMIS